MISFLMLGSLVLGLIAWILPGINLNQQAKAGNKNWVILSIISISDTIIGFASYCTYLSEDGKCFIIDFCILPEFRNKGLGTKIFHEFSEKGIRRGARYFALNTSNNRNKNFWEKQGFQLDGQDEYGSILMRKNILDNSSNESLDSTGFDKWSEGYDKDVEVSEKSNQYPFAAYNEVLIK